MVRQDVFYFILSTEEAFVIESKKYLLIIASQDVSKELDPLNRSRVVRVTDIMSEVENVLNTIVLYMHCMYQGNNIVNVCYILINSRFCTHF